MVGDESIRDDPLDEKKETRKKIKKLPEFVLSEAEEVKLETELKNTVDQNGEEDETERLRRHVIELKLKMVEDRDRCKQLLDSASEVEEKEDETLYKAFFGLIVKDSVNSILKREVVNLALQMSLFRNNISRKMLSDDTLTDETPLNIMNVPKGFEEAWKVWKEQDKNECQEELSYQALKSLII